MKRYIFILIVFMSLLIACGSNAEEQATMTTPASKTTNESLVIASTLTLTPKATHTKEFTLITTTTATMAPTRVPRNTSADTPTATKQHPTSTHQMNVQATKTQQAYDVLATEITNFSIVCDKNDRLITTLSNNGLWLAISCKYKMEQTLEIVSKNGGSWKLKFQDFLSAEFIKDGNTPMGNLLPLHWSNDGSYLYFSPNIAWDGGGTCFYGFGVQSLYRIDLSTGSISNVLPTVSPFGDGYEIAFSPAGKRLVYYVDTPVIMDLRTGDEIYYVDIGESYAGDFSWSPDGSEIVFATCLPNPEGEIEKSAIVIFSLISGKLRTVVELDKMFFRILGEEDHFLKIAIWDYDTGETSYQYFDWSSGEIVSSTPEP